MKFKAFVFALIFAFFSSTTPVFAGGGLVSFDIPWTPQALNPGEQYIVRPTVKQNDGSFCKNCPISIKLENPQESDIINPSSDKTDENGTMYAKVISKISGNRVVFAEVNMPDGSLYTSSSYILHYTDQANSGKAQSFFSNDFIVTVASQNTFSDPTYKGHPREVFLTWNTLSGADTYEVYNRASGTDAWAFPENGVTRETKLKIILSADYDYYVKVQSCNVGFGCRTSNELFVPKYDSRTSQAVSATAENPQVDDLNKKVDQLEDKLNSTQKKQFILEEKLNQLINWLKSLFPNFK